jgi:5S rRNA maturation endonuclease (ribonuclease M5)
MRHYQDYFTVADDYCPVMTSAEINKTPDRWLDFYPHTEFEDICKTLLSLLASGDRSVWITGNYGTGKSNAALVIQKLFMDDEMRVHQWLDDDKNGLTDRTSLKEGLFARRGEGTLVVYDINPAGVGPDKDLLVRLEKGIIAALKDKSMSIPAHSNHESIIKRLCREDSNFFATRDTIQSQLAYLHAGIKTVEQLVEALNKEQKSTDAPSYLLDDVQRVLHNDNIYLDVNVPTFHAWIKKILEANGLKSIVYLFDEFHYFIDANKEQLKTFEEVTETPSVNRFFLVPVTHMEIGAYLAERSETAKKANDRFYFRHLKMPNDTAFRLAKHAMKDVTELADEWKTEKDNLWTTVSSVVDKFNGAEDPKRESFYNILPIHPMAAFLLKFLSELAKSNQRSFFEYLKGSEDGREFQDFIRIGGPEVVNKQFLTVDYLWSFFVENRKEQGLDSDITAIGLTFKQIRDREFSNQTDDAAELRVLKTVLLFCLFDKLSPNVHDRLKPTVENVELSFKGDGIIVDPAGIVRDLERKHCYSIINRNISLFTVSPVSPTEIAKYEGQFHELLSKKVGEMLEDHTKNYRQYSSGRFDIRVSDTSHTTLTNIDQSTRDKYSKGLTKDDGSVCLWFVIAKNKEEQLSIPQRIESMLTQLRDHRILMFTLPSLSFCHNNTGLWSEYVRHYAQYMTENDGTAKVQIKKSLENLEKEWFTEIKKHTAVIKAHQYLNGQVDTSDKSWSVFKDLITGYVRRSLPNCVDYLGTANILFGNSGLKGWATAGIQFNAVPGPQGQVVKAFKGQGVSDSEDWFAQNAKHPLTGIHALFEKKIANTIDKGGTLSVREVYSELQRAPFGMRYNALSAFVLGFILRDILSKNFQWTNGQLTKPLDTDTLAEIIESAIKRETRTEKTICRLSKEEKAFIEKAPAMFDVPVLHDATVESVLGQIQTRIESISVRVPLWVLPEYVHVENDERADMIEQVIDNVCTAFTTSSKGKTEDRTNAIKEAGAAILADSDLVGTILGYIKSENFSKAFEIYVDRENPALAKLAESIGDVSHEYCRAILEKTAETAGWLWKQADISKEIDDMLCEYEVISLVKSMRGFVGFVPYKSVFDTLKTAVMQTNRLPKTMLESAYPVLSGFLSALQTSNATEDIKAALSQSADIIGKLFFNTSKSESVKIVKARLNNVTLPDSDLLGILNGIPGGFGLDEGTFLDAIRAKIEEYAKHSVVLNIKSEWVRISGKQTPSEWAINNGIPTRFIFGGLSQTEDLLKAIEQPETFAATKLAELLEVLKEASAQSIGDCQKAFLTDTVPHKYAKFNISLASLLEFLRGRYGAQPDNWSRHPDISDFIRDQYKSTFAPQIKEKISKRESEELKQRLLQLADENPELGLLFWED